MKKLLILLAACMVVASAFSQEDGSKYKLNKRTGKYDLVNYDLHETVNITATQINAGDSVQILPVAGAGKLYDIDKLVFSFDAGTAYSGTGTDTTFICDRYRSAKNKLAWVNDAMFTGAGDKYEVVTLSGGMDTNSSLWIDFASQYTTGTGTVKISVYYRKIEP